jgi:hypothetical protein
VNGSPTSGVAKVCGSLDETDGMDGPGVTEGVQAEQSRRPSWSRGVE